MSDLVGSEMLLRHIRIAYHNLLQGDNFIITFIHFFCDLDVTTSTSQD